jgi:hypothetical protein
MTERPILMTPTARARIEQAVLKVASGGKGGLTWQDGIELILAERARLKRRVMKTRKITGSMCSTSEFCKGYKDACNDILALWEK